MQTKLLGNTDTRISIIGYGAMALSLPGRPPEDEAVRLIQRVLDEGVTFIDTADTYCLPGESPHHNERLVARALASYRGDASRVCVATKGGTVRVGAPWQINGKPERLYRAIVQSYEALGGKCPIPLWQQHWPDPRYPVRESMRSVRRAVDEGLVRHVGVSNFSVAQLREAREVVDIVSVQNQYNLWCRDPERDGMLEYCEREGVAFLPWRPFGGKGLAQRLGDIRPLAELARERGVSPYRLMMAWFLARSPCILPIPGTLVLDEVLDCLKAVDVKLTAAEVERISRITVDEMPRAETDPRPHLAVTDFDP